MNNPDFYDIMTPHWSNAMAKQYNKDTDMDNKIKDAINPEHYQGIVGNYQYIECMEFILGVSGLKDHLKGQIYKYMMRMGKKDSEKQELDKVIWYARCLKILLNEGSIVGKLDQLK